MAKKSKIETARFVPVTSLVPEQWRGWFYEGMCNSEITWGASNRTLISVDFFLREADDHCSEEAHPAAWREWVKKVKRLPSDVYIDMES